VRVDRDLDDGGGARGQRGLDGIADLIGMLDVVAGGAEESGQLVVARVADVAANEAAPTIPNTCLTPSTFSISTTARPPVQASMCARPPRGATGASRRATEYRVPA